MSCYSSNTICTTRSNRRYEQSSKLVALKMPLGYQQHNYCHNGIDEEFMVRDEVDLVVSLPEVGPILNVPNRIELLEDSSSLLGLLKSNLSSLQLIDVTVMEDNGNISQKSMPSTVRQLNTSTFQGYPKDVLAAKGAIFPGQIFVGIDLIHIYTKYSSKTTVSYYSIEAVVKNKNDPPEIASEHPLDLTISEDTPLALTNLIFNDVEDDLISLDFKVSGGSIDIRTDAPGVVARMVPIAKGLVKH